MTNLVLLHLRLADAVVRAVDLLSTERVAESVNINFKGVKPASSPIRPYLNVLSQHTHI